MNQKNIIHNQFIQTYYFIFDRIIDELNETSLEIQLVINQAYYYLVKVQLIYEFLNHTNDFHFDFQLLFNNQSNSKWFKILHSKFSEFIQKNLIAKFQYKLQESLKDEDDSKITPFIFSLLFENSLQWQEKQKAGVFYTSYDEVNFMCKESLIQYLAINTRIPEAQLISLFWKNIDSLQTNFLMKDLILLKQKIKNIHILDPACGSGAFLLGFLNLLVRIQNKIHTLLNEEFTGQDVLQEILQNNLYGLDIDSEALSICQLRLLYYHHSLTCLNLASNRLNILQENAILSRLDNPIIKEKFDIVIGNPPFIRQEQFLVEIKDQLVDTSNIKDYVYTKLESYFSSVVDLPRERKSDFYIYFFYRGLSLLREGGILSFVTSNSWLDAKFGMNFQKFLLENYQLQVIYANQQSKSFSAAVNTAITFLVNPKPENEIADSLVRFILLKFPNYMNLQLIHRLNIITSTGAFENHRLKITTKKQSDLLHQGIKDDEYRGEKWGSLYFRAPSIITNILDSLKDKFIELSEIGHIRYPIKTGINEFFFLDEDKILEYGISDEFLVPVLKSPKKIQRLEILASELDTKLFTCNYTMDELLNKKKKGAIRYINWGQNQTTELKQQSIGDVPWPKVPSLRNNRPSWYSINSIPPADIFCSRFIDRRFFFCFTSDDLIEDQTFYGLILNEEFKTKKLLVVALLNITLVYSLLEVFGRTSLGKGALQYAKNDFAILPILDPRKLPEKLKNNLLKKFQPILDRGIKPIFEEIALPDRKEFDKLIFDWLGLSEKEVAEIYSSLVDLVSQRLEKSGQSV
ncbi:MAG: N-6 DNA methylase [Asgard group archaeon]|nr:N-6 DNA methylase [Asgard group archaeon]